MLQRFISCFLWIVVCTFNVARACPSSDFPFEISIPHKLEVCENFLYGKSYSVPSNTRKLRLDIYNELADKWTLLNVTIPKDDPIGNSKFEYFNNYDFVNISKANYMCEQTAHLFVGFESNNKTEEKICHIAYEPITIGIDVSENKIEEKFTKTSDSKEVVSGEYGDTEIIRTNYCHKKDAYIMTRIEVKPIQVFDFENEVSFLRRKQAKAFNLPLQHFIATDSKCNQSN